MSESNPRRSTPDPHWRVDAVTTVLVCLLPVALLAAAAAVARRDRGWALALGLWGLITLVNAWWRVRGLAWSREDSRSDRPSFVESIGDGEVTVSEGGVVDRRALRALAGRRGFSAPWLWTFKYSDERELGRLLGELRDMDIIFPYMPGGWPPSAVFEELRERGLVTGPYKAWINYGSRVEVKEQ